LSHKIVQLKDAGISKKYADDEKRWKLPLEQQFQYQWNPFQMYDLKEVISLWPLSFL
jgi:hypothetical protein